MKLWSTNTQLRTQYTHTHTQINITLANTHHGVKLQIEEMTDSLGCLCLALDLSGAMGILCRHSLITIWEWIGLWGLGEPIEYNNDH